MRRKNIFKSRFFRVVFSRKIVVFCTLVLVALALCSIFAPFVAPYDPYAQDLRAARQSFSAEHWLGTDGVGRDMLSRIIYGGRVSFAVGLASAVIAGGLGMLVGLIAGTFGGAVDTAIMRVMDAMNSIPMIILSMFLCTVLGKGLLNICIAIGISMSPIYARVTRGQVLSVREADYVTAGTLSGASKLKNAFYHILPNCLSANIVMMTNSIGAAILNEASLSYLGLGINPPTASWGAMVSDGKQFMSSVPIIAIAPGVMVMITVLCFNMLGDAVRDASDPKLKGTFGSLNKKKKNKKAVAKANAASMIKG